MHIKSVFTIALMCSAGAFAQTTITVGVDPLVFPSTWQSTPIAGVPYAIASYTGTGSATGSAIFIGYADTSAVNTTLLAQTYATALGQTGTYHTVKDSSFSSGLGQVSVVDFILVDTTGPDTTHGRLYFSTNGHRGIMVEAIPETPSAISPMYTDVTTALKGWAATAIFAQHAFHSGNGSILVSQKVDILGRRRKSVWIPSGSLRFPRP